MYDTPQARVSDILVNFDSLDVSPVTQIKTLFAQYEHIVYLSVELN